MKASYNLCNAYEILKKGLYKRIMLINEDLKFLFKTIFFFSK